MEAAAESAKEKGHHWLFSSRAVLQPQQVSYCPLPFLPPPPPPTHTYEIENTFTCTHSPSPPPPIPPSRHRCLNMFLQTYCSQWLVSSEHYTHDHLTEELLDKQDYIVSRRREEMKRMPENERRRRLREAPPPDPLTQLLHMFKRIATSREWYSLQSRKDIFCRIKSNKIIICRTISSKIY